MRSSKYSAELLAPIEQSSRSLAEVMRKLGLPPTGGNHRLISSRVRSAGLDTSHFGRSSLAARCAAVPAQQLEHLVRESTSIAQVLAKLQLPTEGRSHSELTKRIEQLGLDTKHFRGQGWSRGETSETRASVRRVSQRLRMPDTELFVENSSFTHGTKIVRRLLAMGWPYRCTWCGIAEWRGEPLVLHLDHINGINNDNRLVNLRLLCPNCHSCGFRKL